MTDENDHSAWAPVRRTIRWLRVQARDENLSWRTRLQAEEMARDLSEALPRLGGGQMEEECRCPK